MCVKRGSYTMSNRCVDVTELLGSTRTISTSTDPVGPYLCFLWMKHEERQRFLSKTSALKQESVIGMKQKRPHAWLSGVSIRYPRTWHWDPWLIMEAGLWKSRNLGIRFWQRACWHGDIPLQLSWTRMTWVCYWDEKLWHAHVHAWYVFIACMHFKELGHNHNILVVQPIYFGRGAGDFLENNYSLILSLSKVKHESTRDELRTTTHNIRPVFSSLSKQPEIAGHQISFVSSNINKDDLAQRFILI